MNLGLPKYCAPASLLNWLRHLSEMRLSEGWQLAVRQQGRCRTGRLWSRCGLLSYPMGSCWGPRGGEAFPDWKWQTSFPYVQLPCVPWKFPLWKVSAVPAVSMLQGCPILFCFQTLKKRWYAGHSGKHGWNIEKNQWTSAVNWDVRVRPVRQLTQTGDPARRRRRALFDQRVKSWSCLE